jgi:hypothetical protein
MNESSPSGIYANLRAKCERCGIAFAKHPFCTGCGAPHTCADEREWTARGKAETCPDCCKAAVG